MHVLICTILMCTIIILSVSGATIAAATAGDMITTATKQAANDVTMDTNNDITMSQMLGHTVTSSSDNITGQATNDITMATGDHMSSPVQGQAVTSFSGLTTDGSSTDIWSACIHMVHWSDFTASLRIGRKCYLTPSAHLVQWQQHVVGVALLTLKNGTAYNTQL